MKSHLRVVRGLLHSGRGNCAFLLSRLRYLKRGKLTLSLFLLMQGFSFASPFNDNHLPIRVGDCRYSPFQSERIWAVFPAEKLWEMGRVMMQTHDRSSGPQTGNLSLVALAATPNGNGVLFVDSSVAVAGNGSSWNQALKYLSDATAAANADLTIKEIHVAKGTYYPTGQQGIKDSSKTFALYRAGLKVLGGYPGGGGVRVADGSQPTILSGNIGVVGDTADNSLHVVMIAGIPDGTDTLLLDGFTVTGGMAHDFPEQDFNGQTARGLNGAGIYLAGVSANTVVSNCIVQGNSAANPFGGKAGGIYITNASPLLRHLMIRNNEGNYGGGITVDQVSYPYMDDIQLYENTATNFGGGFLTMSFGANPILSNSIVQGNTAPSGGGLSNQGSFPKFYNVLVTGNTGTTGGGIYDGSHGSSAYYNVTVSGNSASEAGGGAYFEGGSVAVYNSIFYGNAGPDGREIYYNSNDTISVRNCIFPTDENALHQQANPTASNNLHSDPIFIAPLPATSAPVVGGNYRVKMASPAVDAGIDSIVTTWNRKELDQKDRIYREAQGGVIDIGAYESNFGLLVHPDQNGIVYVDSAKGTDGDGSTWAKALRYLSTATKYAAAKPGITAIHVAKGTYYPTGQRSDTNRFAAFNLNRPSIKLIGGYPSGGGIRDISVNTTVMSGNIGLKADSADNSFHVVSIMPVETLLDSIVVDGFTITGGQADTLYLSLTNMYGTNYGGGILTLGLLDDKFVIRNCRITDNHAQSGAGMTNFGLRRYMDFIPSKPIITNCIFDHNTTLSASDVQSTVPMGAAILNMYSEPRIDGCSFIQNQSVMGAAIANYVAAGGSVLNSVFKQNVAQGFPVLINFNASNTLLANCLISENEIQDIAMAGPLGIKSLLANVQTAKLRLVNVTVAGNKSLPQSPDTLYAVTNLGGASTYITNSLIDGNVVGAVKDSAESTSSVSYSLIKGQPADPARHILDGSSMGDPFVDTASGNYHLKPGTLPINAGINDSTSGLNISSDLAGAARIYDNTVDLGAYEFEGKTVPVRMGPLTGQLDVSGHAQLRWTTFTETANKGFTVEKSLDGKHFESAAFVPSKAKGGNSQNSIPYNYDAGYLSEAVFYRLAQLDLNGHQDYSNTIHLKPGGQDNALRVYPIPAHDYLQIDLPTDVSSAHIQIVDMQGRVVLQKEIDGGHERIAVSSLAAGVYLLKVDATSTKAGVPAVNLSQVIRFSKR